MNYRVAAITKIARVKALATIVISLFFLLAMPGREFNELESIIESGKLQVASRVGPLSYFEREGEPNGLDYNLLTALSQSLGVELEITLYDELEQQLEAVYTDDIDLAAATLTATEARKKRYEFSEAYLQVSAVLVQHSSESPKQSLADLEGENYLLRVIAGSSHAEVLSYLQEDYPGLRWQEDPEVIMFQLMEQVQQQQIDYGIVDSAIFELERSMFPRVEVGMHLTDPEPIAFVLPKDSDGTLLEAINAFLSEYQESGQLSLLQQAYFVDAKRMDVAGSLLFKERLQNRLPDFETLFRTVAEEHDYDWLLLAAQAYQESHWEPKARSPTGVRGLMMLTLPTARQLGVDNRLDPEQSLRGGLEYMLSLHSRLPERITEPDRTKFALAAYNVGFGHLNDARILAQRDGANADSWEAVENYLPLLRQRKYYSTLKYGYARGNEPVIYVNNIYRFKNILDWYTWQRELEIQSIFVDQEPEERPYENVLDMPLSPL